MELTPQLEAPGITPRTLSLVTAFNVFTKIPIQIYHLGGGWKVWKSMPHHVRKLREQCTHHIAVHHKLHHPPQLRPRGTERDDILGLYLFVRLVLPTFVRTTKVD